jgi:hypothetical protein
MQFPLTDLLRQSLYSRLAGYDNVKDAERLSVHFWAPVSVPVLGIGLLVVVR